ncbi:hypothetical protein [Flavobacterium sp. SLB02]|uniref:hypothetical protein n=1 Tax=Flavobacterium sp. SLB02 TaxID=2665645 RepID=UPI0012A95DF0|nr:hypothetical protein [Flavobacterium sp. SLB02]QGK73211.1 hypothetical protein GIY83_03770 [Flavobacterium sp. SLB02]
MTHEEMQDQFILQNLSEGTEVQLTLIDGSTIIGTLSNGNVLPEIIIGGRIIGSRIGLFSGPLTVMQPYFSEDIVEIIEI